MPDSDQPKQWEYYTGFPKLVLRLETLFPDVGWESVIYDTCHSAISVAKKLDVIVNVKMNEVDVQFFPDDSDVEAKVDAFKVAQSNGWTTIA